MIDLAGAIYLFAFSTASFTRAAPSEQVDPALVGYALSTWKAVGRSEVSRWSGLHWDVTTESWELVPNWRDSDDAARLAYGVEPILRALVGVAATGNQADVVDEASRFYLAYLSRFRTIGEVRGESRRHARISTLLPQGQSKMRTLPWRHRIVATSGVPGECALCSMQFLHPAARLIRVVASLPATVRTPAMLQFVSAYTPLIAEEHLIRLGYQTAWKDRRVSGLSDTLLQRWDALAAGAKPAGPRHRYAIRDVDLWMIAIAAELLEAERRDSHLLMLAPRVDSLRWIVSAGVAVLALSTTPHPETQTPDGRVVGSLGYFESDFDEHPDMRCSGYSGDSIPFGPECHPRLGGSWDTSHIQRLPVFLRSLWDARRSTGVDFPTRSQLVATVNQFLYVAFQGDWALPLVRNFFDGGDGWFRVGYEGRRDWGYPPAQLCDQRVPNRPCLTRTAILGWSELAFAHEELGRLPRAMLQLSQDSTRSVRDFVLWKYASKTDSFRLAPSARPPAYSLLLFQVLGEYLGSQVADVD